MFEMIGLMFATAFLFVLASFASGLLVAVTWLLVRRADQGRVRLLILAAAIPIASAAYFWLCIALLPGESWFGDINEILPNGYVITALGKMPDFASIGNPKYPYRNTGISQYVGRIAIDGSLVVGQYSHPLGEFTPNPGEPYFLFDTRASQTKEFQTQVDLEHELGHPVHLTPIETFRSKEPVAVRRRRLNTTIEIAPPILAVCFLGSMIFRARARILPGPSNIYA